MQKEDNGLLAVLKKYAPANMQEEADKELILEYLNTFKDVLSRDNKMTHVICMAFVINNEADKALMVHHNIFKSWSLPGGHADGCADLVSVALKEVKEETGLDVVANQGEIYAIDILPVPGHMKNGRYVSAHTHISLTFKLCGDSMMPLQNNPNENSAVGWFELDKLTDITDEKHMQEIYRKLYTKLMNEEKEK